MSLGGVLTGVGFIVAFVFVFILVRRRRSRAEQISGGRISTASVRPAAGLKELSRKQTVSRMPDHDPESAFLSEALDVLLSGATLPGGPPMESTEAAPRMLHRALLTLKGMDRMGETFARFQEFNDPYASLEQLANAVSKDVVLSSKVLRSANSAYFGYAEGVTSVQHAARILGFNNLKTLYFQEHFKMLDPTESSAASRHGLWKHAMLTAVAASHISAAFKKTSSETAFTLGLMHDIGKFILCQMPMPEDGHKQIQRIMAWEPVVRTSEDCATSVDVERKLLGIDHCLLGMMAMEDWDLPELMTMVVRHHHSGGFAARELDEEAQSYVAVIHAADFIARVFDHRGDAELPPGGGLEAEFLEHTSKPAMEKAVLSGAMLQDLTTTEALVRMSG